MVAQLFLDPKNIQGPWSLMGLLIWGGPLSLAYSPLSNVGSIFCVLKVIRCSLKLNGGNTIEGSPNFQTTGRGFGGAPSTKIQFAPQILIFKLICTLNFI